MSPLQDTEEFAQLEYQARWAEPHAVALATSWIVAPAVFGAGTILVGPDERSSDKTCAIVPPGVWARSPDSGPEPFLRDGWRVHVWAANRRIDQHRPVELRHVTLDEVCALLADETDALNWAREVVSVHIRTLRSLLSGPEDPSVNRDLAERLATLERQAEHAFGTCVAPAPKRRLTDDAGPWAAGDIARR